MNPARSIGPALIVGGYALSQLWVFILSPLVGGAIAAFAHEYLFPARADVPPTIMLPEAPEQRAAAATESASEASTPR